MARIRFFQDPKCNITADQISKKFTFTIVILIFLSAYIRYIDLIAKSDALAVKEEASLMHLISSTFIGLMIICYGIYNFKESKIGPKNRYAIDLGLNIFILLIGISAFTAVFVLDKSFLSTIAAHIIVITIILPMIVFFLFWRKDMSD